MSTTDTLRRETPSSTRITDELNGKSDVPMLRQPTSALAPDPETSLGGSLTWSEPSGSISSAKARIADAADTPSRAAPARSSTRQYIAVARPALVRRLTVPLRKAAAVAGQPAVGQYMFEVNRVAQQAIEQFFDDAYLDVVLAVRDALFVGSAWMTMTGQQFISAADILENYQRVPYEDGSRIRDAVMELERAGINTTPAIVPLDLLLDEEYEDA